MPAFRVDPFDQGIMTMFPQEAEHSLHAFPDQNVFTPPGKK